MSVEAEDISLQYEALRRNALTKQRGFYQRSLGLALFIRQGMLAWIEVCRRCTPTSAINDQRQNRPAVAYEPTSEMIKIMANITLGILEGAAS